MKKIVMAGALVFTLLGGVAVRSQAAPLARTMAKTEAENITKEPAAGDYAIECMDIAGHVDGHVHSGEESHHGTSHLEHAGGHEAEHGSGHEERHYEGHDAGHGAEHSVGNHGHHQG